MAGTRGPASRGPAGRCPAGRTILTSADPIAARNPLRYRACYTDAETGLSYLPARYYDPATFRFLSPDSAPPSAGDPLSLNAYAYCLGDPVGMSDPPGAIADLDGDGKASSGEVAIHDEVVRQERAGRSGFRTSYWRAWMVLRERKMVAHSVADAQHTALSGRSWAAMVCHDTSPFGRCNDIDALSYPSPESFWATVMGGSLDLLSVGTSAIKVKLGGQLMAASRSSALLSAGIAYDGYVFESVDEAWEAGYATKLDRDMSHLAVVPGIGAGMVYLYAWGKPLGYEFAEPR